MGYPRQETPELSVRNFPVPEAGFGKSSIPCHFPFWSARVHGESVVQRGATSVELGQPVGGDQGSWARWRWDGEVLTATNDRHGFLPLFYSVDAQEARTISVSASPIQLINEGVSPALDFDALAVFMRVGFFLANDTPFRDIKVLPPGAKLKWRPGELSIQTTERRIKPYTGTREAALDDFITLFRTSIEKRPPTDEEFVLPLSGGRDSRHILLELVRQGHAPSACLTLGATTSAGGTDALVAEQLARALGISHRVLPRDPGRGVRREFTKNELTHMSADEHDWFMPLATTLPALTRCTYSGVAGTWEPDGGTPATSRISKLLDEGIVEPVPNLLLQHFGADEVQLARMLSRAQRDRMPIRTVQEKLTSEIKRYLESPNPLGSFWFWNRERREHALAAHGLLAGIPTVYMPFLDDNVVDLLESLPTSFFRDSSFHTDAISRAFPEFAGIPFATTQSSMVARRSPSDLVEGVVELARFTLRHNLRRLPSVARFTLAQALGTTSLNLRMTAFLIQLESIASREAPPRRNMVSGVQACAD